VPPGRPLREPTEAAEEYHLNAVLRVLAASVDVEAVARGWAERVGLVRKALDPDAQAYASGVQLDLAGLTPALTSIYGDGYLLGLGAAIQQARDAGIDVATDQGVYAIANGVNWNEWKPGHRAAASQLSGAGGGRGLTQLLADSGVTISGVTASTLDDIARVLAAGAAAGDSVDGIASALRAMLGQRAEVVAHTELARAMGVASMDTYRANDIAGKSWLTWKPCPICEQNEAAGVIPLEAAFPGGVQAPPQHPRCRCSLAPSYRLP